MVPKQPALALGLATLLGIGIASDASDQVFQEVAQHYAHLAYTEYSDALAQAQRLKASLARFIEDPSPTTMEAARTAWIRARTAYLPTEAFRFYGGPIDDERGLEPMINGWPLDESYIDYVEGAPEAGIIQDTENYPRLTPGLLQRQNERAGETAITCGYHAIEFLLWGQDHFEDSPGQRRFTDYTSAPNAARRGHYLRSCAELLSRHLAILKADWEPDDPLNYRARFLESNPAASIWFAIYGLKTFVGTELAGERLLVAWDTQAQEDEHSCFSDTTLQDLRGDVLGLIYLFSGDYPGINDKPVRGPGLRAALQAVDPESTEQLADELDRALKLVEAIPSPFDQAILGDRRSPGREAILASVEQLESIAARLADFEQRLMLRQRSSSRR